ncbi:hypothetical protein F4820DRAFT_365645 [Hypoxylon rubiginosum]|uniref:Uncharacterized protein n=1 Tax=Hypoxylon rubiginosum TaxID=110542 RepID=A0ACB9ZFZ6_9PEZI|nr:hypothetical protein F4820DRAFT_365645 [Hypoxylon rubiginosum]
MSKPIPIPPRKGSRQPEADQEPKPPRWSEIEDKILKQGVARHGVNAWGKVAMMIWTRKDADQCRARWAELVPILHDEVARKEAARAKGPLGRERSTTSPASTSTAPRARTYFEPSSPSAAAEMARQLETAAGGFPQTPTPVPIRTKPEASSSSSSSRKSRTQPGTPLDESPPLLNPLLSPPPPFEMSPPSPPSHMPPPRPLHRSSTTTTMTTPTKSRFPSPLSLLSLAPLRRDRSKTAPTSPLAPAPETRKKKSSSKTAEEDDEEEDEDENWLSPHPLMPGLYRKPSKGFRK